MSRPLQCPRVVRVRVPGLQGPRGPRGASIYFSRTEAAALVFAPNEQTLALLGYYAPGDAPFAIYTRANSPPSHPGKFQSAGGIWWELVASDSIDIRNFGARVNGTANDTQAVKDMISW